MAANLLHLRSRAQTTSTRSVRSLAWLLRHHAIPNGDARPAQLVAGAGTPPSSWPEALTAGLRLAERLTALLGGP